MSERNPEEQDSPNRFWYTVNGESYPLTPEFADPYLHSEEPWFDHIYIDLPQDEDGNARGGAIWRIDHDSFDDVVGDLIRQGGDPYLETYASEGDKAYFLRCGREIPEQWGDQVITGAEPLQEPRNVLQEASEVELLWVSPRNEALIERTASYIIYLAERNELL